MGGSVIPKNLKKFRKFILEFPEGWRGLEKKSH